MRKRIIKIGSLAIALFLSVSFLAGCMLFERNYAREMAEVVATISVPVQTAEVEKPAAQVGTRLYLLEFTDFGADGRAIMARQVNDYGTPARFNADGELVTLGEDDAEQRFDISEGRPNLWTGEWAGQRPQNPNGTYQSLAGTVWAMRLDQNGARNAAPSPLLTNTARREFVSPQIRIYQAQLVNQFNQNAGQFITAGMSRDELREVVEQILDNMIGAELILLEADKQFFAGNLYWTEQDVEDIQRSVYETIDAQIFRHKNAILERRGEDLLTPTSPGAAPEPEREFPVPPPPAFETEDSPRYHAGRVTHDDGSLINRNEYRWHDQWYTADDWFIQTDPSLVATFPGMWGTPSQQSLSREALNSFLEEMLDNAEFIIGLNDEHRDKTETQIAHRRIIDEEAAELRRVANTYGISYVYPLMGRTLTFKYLIGMPIIRQMKMEKLQQYITRQVQVTTRDVEVFYAQRLEEQRRRFVDTAAYSAAVEANDLILYTPNDRYLWVKHILLPFHPEDLELLEAARQRYNPNRVTEGAPHENFVAARALIAENMRVYRNVDGNRDRGNPFTKQEAVSRISNTMSRYRNAPVQAERAFIELIFEWNTDPGMFNNSRGYNIITNPDETDRWMPEFTEGGRAFRTGNYRLGQLLTDIYVITDFGIHIMYYAADPGRFNYRGAFQLGGEIGLNSFTTPGRQARVVDALREELLQSRRAEVWQNWEAVYVRDFRRDYSDTVDSAINRLTRRWHRQIFR